MYHVFIRQGVFLCIDNCAVPTVEDNVFTHLEYISQGSTPRHSYTKQGSLGKNFINPLTLRICSSHTFCVLRSWVLCTLHIKAAADRKIRDEINYRWDSNYHNILFPCDPHIISNRKIVELIPTFRTFCDAIILLSPIELCFKWGGGKVFEFHWQKYLINVRGRSSIWHMNERKMAGSEGTWSVIRIIVTLSGRVRVPGGPWVQISPVSI